MIRRTLIRRDLPEPRPLENYRLQLFIRLHQASAIEVHFAATSSAPQQGCLAMRSDDPDDSPWTIELAANLPALGVGDPAPGVALELLGGGSWSLSDARGEVVVLAYFATF